MSNIFWDTESKTICTYRIARDGQPPDELDGDPFYVTGGDESRNILALYDKNNPKQMVPPKTEDSIRTEQMSMDYLRPI